MRSNILIIMTKGAYLYYGFKISEKEMVERFFTREFKQYVREEVKDAYYREYENEIYEGLDTNTPYKNNGKLSEVYKNLFTNYYNDYVDFVDFEDSEDYVDSIELVHAPCCLYDEITDWIIGIKIAKLSVYPRKAVSLKKTKMHKLTIDEIKCLDQIQKKYNLDFDSLDYYHIPMDCYSCT